MTVGHCIIQLGVWGGVSPTAGPGQSPGGGPGGEAPGSTEDPKVYMTKKRPETDSHRALLTEDMPIITLLSPKFWCCWGMGLVKNNGNGVN